jgi:mannose-6-phosphate isomerase-like protein (cupin superfamily)
MRFTAFCGSSSTRVVSPEGAYLVGCKRCLAKMARHEAERKKIFDRKVAEAAKAKTDATRARLNREPEEAHQIAQAVLALGIASKVTKIYDRAQDNALDGLDAEDREKMSEEKQGEFSHHHGIEAVWTFLVGQKIITPDTKESVIDLAYTEIS